MTKWMIFTEIITLVFLFACSGNGQVITSLTPATTATAPATSSAVPVYTYRIINLYPHDPEAFTQGLAYENGLLYEGTGLYGRSTLRLVEIETGRILQSLRLPDRYFGEGITLTGNRVVQITYQSNVGFVYDKATFQLLSEFSYQTEGWGITFDGKRLIMSDGTAKLRLLDPETFVQIGSVEVADVNGPVVRLNELEYVKGVIYANIWQTDKIAMIAPDTGRVTGWIDLAGLLRTEDRVRPVDVMNGIAYDADNDRLFVTGKLWPKLFEIKFVLR